MIQFNPCLIENLRRKRDRLAGHEDIRPVLFILSGANRGCYGAGQGLVIQKLGFGKVFDVVIGISIGAAIGGYFLTGQAKGLLGASICYQELASRSFIDFRRWRKAVDIDFVMSVMSSGEKKLDTAAILESPTDFFVGVTTKSGTFRFLDAKATGPGGVLSAIHASIALPGDLYGRTVTVNGEEYMDGSFNPFPIREVIERFNPTDILVLPNIPFRPDGQWRLSPFGAFLTRLVLRDYPRHLVAKALNRKVAFGENVRYCENGVQSINIGILWPPDLGVQEMTRDSRLLRLAAVESAKATMRAFGESTDISLL